MKSNNFILLIFALLFIQIYNVESFGPNEKIKVLYLEAPLFFSKYGTLLANISAFHSGLGFISEETNEQYTIDFVAYPGVLESVLPKGVIANTVIWDTSGKVQIKDYINGSNYWVQTQEVMEINNDIFEAFVCWAVNYNNTYTWYELFDVIDVLRNQTTIDSRVCNDFVWEGINTLYNLGGNYINDENNPNLPIIAKRDFITIYSYGDPYFIENGSNNPEIVEFYSAMLNISRSQNQTVNGLIDELDKLFNGNYYLYFNNNYYNVTLASPPLSFTYSESPLASGERSQDNIPLIGNCFSPAHNLTPSNKKSLGGGWIFIIILLCSITTYLVGGVLINKYLKNKSGIELLPNTEFWSGLGGLISDGFSFVKGKITGTTNSASGYNVIS